jgi:hypothetical protein
MFVLQEGPRWDVVLAIRNHEKIFRMSRPFVSLGGYLTDRRVSGEPSNSKSFFLSLDGAEESLNVVEECEHVVEEREEGVSDEDDEVQPVAPPEDVILDRRVSLEHGKFLGYGLDGADEQEAAEDDDEAHPAEEQDRKSEDEAEAVKISSEKSGSGEAKSAGRARRCWICKDRPSFGTFAEFHEHNRKHHLRPTADNGQNNKPTPASSSSSTSTTSDSSSTSSNGPKPINANMSNQPSWPEPIQGQDGKWICGVGGCTRSFEHRGSVHEHRRQKHLPNAGFVCGAVPPHQLNRCDEFTVGMGCGATYSKKSGLENHIRAKHLGLPSRYQEDKARQEAAAAASRPATTATTTTTSNTAGPATAIDPFLLAISANTTTTHPAAAATPASTNTLNFATTTHPAAAVTPASFNTLNSAITNQLAAAATPANHPWLALAMPPPHYAGPDTFVNGWNQASRAWHQWIFGPDEEGSEGERAEQTEQAEQAEQTEWRQFRAETEARRAENRRRRGLEDEDDDEGEDDEDEGEDDEGDDGDEDGGDAGENRAGPGSGQFWNDRGDMYGYD